MRNETTEQSRGKWLGRLTALAIGSALYAGVGGAPAAAACDKPVDLRFTYWGTAFEEHDIEAAVRTFNTSHSCIHVESQHIPYPDYAEKLTTMLAASSPLDVAYVTEDQALRWAKEGKI